MPEVSEGKNQRYSIKSDPAGYLLPAGRCLFSVIEPIAKGILFDFGFLSQQGISGIPNLMATIIIVILVSG